MLSLIRNTVDSPQKSLSAGFTLIELIIVIMILSIMASMGFVTVRSFSERQALNIQTEEFTAALQLARSRAQAQVKPESGSCAVPNASLQGYQVAVSCNGNGNNCSQYQLSAVCGGTETLIRQESFPSQLSVRATGNYGATPYRIRFDTVTGQVAAIIGPVRVNFRDANGNTRYVEVTKEGSITHD